MKIFRAAQTPAEGGDPATFTGEVMRATLASDKTPGLGNVPVIKWLFKRDRIDESNTELLIFITPRIVRL